MRPLPWASTRWRVPARRTANRIHTVQPDLRRRHRGPDIDRDDAGRLCIDLGTPTQIGFGYTLGEWSESNVPNVGHVARLLNSYYPNHALPALANNNERAATVQASIWFFTDRYVLLTSNPLLAP